MSLFIVFEGVDHSGKTTFCQRLRMMLKKQNLTVFNTFEPGGSCLGEDVRNILLKSNYDLEPVSELLLFLSDRYQHVQKHLLPALKKFDIVLCDRYFYSTFVYQGHAKAVSIQLILQLHEKLGLLKLIPDFLFFLSSTPSSLQKRNILKQETEVDRFHTQDSIKYFVQMHQFYLQTFDNLKKYIKKLEIIDTSQNLDDNLAKIYTIIRKKWATKDQ